MSRVPYPGIRVTTNGNQLVSYYTEARIADGGVFYPITPSTEMGENFQLAFAEGRLNVFGGSKLAVETEGEHSAQGGAIAFAACGKRTVNFTSGQGVVYGAEQFYHAPGKLSTMVLEVAARALTRHALNVHCGHDDIYAVLDAGWIVLFAKDAQQAADQALIIRRVTELALVPGINAQDGFLTSHLERTFFMHEAALIREFLGAPDDLIECPTDAQRTLFGPTRRRVPRLIDLANPVLLGPVQNQEHYMNGVVARRTAFYEPVQGFLEKAYEQFAALTGRRYGLISCYHVDDAETVFVSIGSAAENIEAAVDLLRGRGARVGSVHVNVLRPFPEVALVRALAGKRHVIVLERTDQPLAGDNPLARDLRAAFTRALEADGEPRSHGMPALAAPQVPRIFSGVYGLGSRDFRPEGILGAYAFATGTLARQDGRTEADGTSFFVVGVDHPYQVKAAERPSLLPDGAIAVRLHSIGGWGMITTGKNLGEIIGALGEHVAERENTRDEFGRLNELVHVSANPKYGSEKKGAPTEYFLVVAPERIRVNCDLRHVSVVLCCDPKAFTHTNPIDGLEEGGAFVWESDESPATAWTRIPVKHRQAILDRRIRVYILPGFSIARGATDRADLQLRMQGNAFLGAFFKVSDFLKEFGIGHDHFVEQVEKQYRKKFGRFGAAVVTSNMQVMLEGFGGVREIEYGAVDAPDRSAMRAESCVPRGDCASACVDVPLPPSQERAPVFRRERFDREFRVGLGYHQPASVYAAAGVLAAGTGATASKFVARRQTPVFIAENCTQCMDCITSCPDTALPNTAQDLGTVLATAIKGYVGDARDRETLLAAVPQLDASVRAAMLEEIKAKRATPFADLVRTRLAALDGIGDASRRDLLGILDTLPIAYARTNAVFANVERKSPGAGGLFSIFVSDLCKGCGECVTECGDHQALKMVDETEALTARHATAIHFLNLLSDTPQKYLGLYDAQHPQESKEAALKNHLMVRSSYDALVSGDAACAGCGEKSILHAVASLTEAYMRPIYRDKAERLRAKVSALRAEGEGRLAALAARTPEGHVRLQRAVAHLLLGLGGEDERDTDTRLAAHGPVTDKAVLDALCAVMTQDAFNHVDLQAIDGRLANGISVMAMAAHTGCNTVYGSTPPNNPHPYPWMNSLFQDGATVAWLFGESFAMDHARRSVIPERLADAVLDLDGPGLDEGTFFALTHFTDGLMTPREIAEMPKAWAIGGDGGMGDIGFQNVSKVVLQNRPNVKLLMLDTQVYSNTGGQNSDSSLMTGGFDMNQFGVASQGKLIEKKGLAEIFVSGHGSPYVAQVSMANVPKFYKAVLDALEYRGTAFLQAFTSCQPEHGVADDVSTLQAQRARDARLMPEFTFHPSRGESYQEALDLKGNPAHDRDWWEKSVKATGEKVKYTVAHYAATEARFRPHLRPVDDATAATLVPLEHMLTLISQDDVVHRRVFDETHRSFVPDFAVSVIAEDAQGRLRVFAMSRQLVLLCVERRKAWRLLQSKAGIDNVEYRAQRAVLARLDKGELSRDDVLASGSSLVRECIQAAKGPAAAVRAPVGA